MKKVTLILLLISLIIMAVSAEDMSISVDQAVEMALQNNIGLQMSAVELRTKKRTMDTAIFSNFLPSMNASVGYSYGDVLFGKDTASGSTFIPINGTDTPAGTVYSDQLEVQFEDQEIPVRKTMTLGFQASLPINMALGKGVRQTILDYNAGKLDFEKASKEMEVNIRKQFWLIKALQAGVELEKKNLETLQKRYEQTRINYENGLVPELAVLSAQVSLENKRPSLSQQESELENTLAYFKFLLGMEQSDGLELDGEMELEIAEYDSEELISQHLNQRLDVQQINQQIGLVENGKDITALYSRTPTLSLGFQWGSQVSDPFESGSWDDWMDNYTLSATLAIPLDGFIPNSKKDLEISGMKDTLDTLDLTRKQVYENAIIEITNLVRKLENSKKKLDAYAYNVELAEKSYRLNSEAYDLGTVELLDVEDAQDKLFQAQYAVLFEKYNYLSAQLDLNLALNREITE